MRGTFTAALRITHTIELTEPKPGLQDEQVVVGDVQALRTTSDPAAVVLVVSGSVGLSSGSELVRTCNKRGGIIAAAMRSTVYAEYVAAGRQDCLPMGHDDGQYWNSAFHPRARSCKQKPRSIKPEEARYYLQCMSSGPCAGRAGIDNRKPIVEVEIEVEGSHGDE